MSDELIRPQDPRALPEVTLASKYYPELDYEAQGYTPFGIRTRSSAPGMTDVVEGPGEHFCTRCHKYYQNLAKDQVWDPKDFQDSGWPIICYGDKNDKLKEFGPERIEQMVYDGILEDTPESRENFLTSLNPVAWAEREFGIKLDWYQREMILCTAQWRTVRGGRRIGKSTVLEVEVLYSCYTKDGKDVDRYEILIVCPYEVQVKKIFDDLIMLINRSSRLKGSVKRSTKGPYEIEFHNGAVIRGFSSGKKGGARSDKIRSQGANKIYFDETDFMADQDIETILAVMGSQKDTSVWMSTTPTGGRTKFWLLCTDKKLRYKEFHYISAESPRWADSVERMLKSIYSPGGFLREFLADFGTPTEGVFGQKQLDKCLREYSYSSCSRVPHFRYIMGVDWNKTTGTHMVILEQGYTESEAGKNYYYRIVDKVVVRKQEFLHHETMMTLLELDNKWRCDYIYVDQGYGEVQVEGLYREDLKHPELNLRFSERIHAINGNHMVVLKDPRNPGFEIKKPAKPFMVDLLSSWVDANVIFFPVVEDTHQALIESEIPFLDIGVIQQMREFRVEKYSPTNQPRYSQGYEHTLMALCFACLGMAMHFSEINEQNVDGTIVYSPTPLGMPKREALSAQEQAEEGQKKAAIVKRTHEITKPNRTTDTRDPDDIGIYRGSADFGDLKSLIETGSLPRKRLGQYHSVRFNPSKRTIP